MSFPGFKETFREFLDKIDLKEQLDFMKQQREVLNLAHVQSCLSIGPGFGDIDRAAIQTLMPSLEIYTGVEKDGDFLQDLNYNLKAVTTDIGHPVQLNLYQMDVEEWEGPAEPVDVILLFHVIYYVKNPEALLRKCKSWLAPGGTLWLTYSDVSNMSKHVNTYFHIDSTTSFTPVKVGDLIQKMNFKWFKTFRVNQFLDLSSFNKNFVSFCLYHQASEEECRQFKNMVEREYGDEKVEKLQVQVYICKL